MNFAAETPDAPRGPTSEFRGPGAEEFDGMFVVEFCGTLVEFFETLVEFCGTLIEFCGTLIEFFGTLVEFFGTLVEFCGTLIEFCGTFVVLLPPTVPFGFMEVGGFFGGSFTAGSRFETPFDGFICTFADARAEGTVETVETAGTSGDVRATDFRGGTTALAGVSCGLGAGARRRTLNRGLTTRCLIAVSGGGDSSLTTTESSSVALRMREGEVSSKMVSCDNSEISAGWTAWRSVRMTSFCSSAR